MPVIVALVLVVSRRGPAYAKIAMSKLYMGKIRNLTTK